MTVVGKGEMMEDRLSGVEVPEEDCVRDRPGRGDLGEVSIMLRLPGQPRSAECVPTHGASTLMICPSSLGGP